MKKDLLKSIGAIAVLLTLSPLAPSFAQLKPKATQKASRVADSYEANYYYLNNKSGDSQGLKGELKASSTAITLKTSADDLNLSLKINETPAFEISKGVNGDPTFYGENTGWNRFSGAGSLAFFGGARGTLNASDVPSIFVGSNARVGINTTNPAYQLDLSTTAETFGIVQSYGNGGPGIGFKTSTSYGGVGTTTTIPVSFLVNGQRVGTFTTDGNFGIGTTSPTQKLQVQGNSVLMGTVGINSDLTGISSDNLNRYSVFVNKGILSENYALGPKTSWADFVFSKDYKLPNLSVVEAYISANGHLPAIPSAEEVQKQGYSLHDINVRMLQKIEELTLYSIEQQKEINKLKLALEQYNTLSQEVEKLKRTLAKGNPAN